MRKGVSLPVEFVIIVAIAVLVLVVTVIFLFTMQGPSSSTVTLAQAQASCGTACIADKSRAAEYINTEVPPGFNWPDTSFCKKKFTIDGKDTYCYDISSCTLKSGDIEESSSSERCLTS
jgi:hypothetical protein